RVLAAGGIPAVGVVLPDQRREPGCSGARHAGAGEGQRGAGVGGDVAVVVGRDDALSGYRHIRLDAAVGGGAATAEARHVVGGGGALRGAHRDAVLGGRGAAYRAASRPGVAGGEKDQEILVIPHELVHVLAARRVVVLHGGVLVVAPGVG